METVCQPSYPLNSANASPPGTFTLYLSCAERAKPPRTTRQTVVIPIVSTFLRFIEAPRVSDILTPVAMNQCIESNGRDQDVDTPTIFGVVRRANWTMVSVDTFV